MGEQQRSPVAAALADGSNRAAVGAVSPLGAQAVQDAPPATAVADRTVPTTTATWPCTACGAANALLDDACRTCGLRFLAAAADTEPLLVLPLVGDLTAMSKGRRTWLAVAVVAGFVVLCAVLGLLLA